MKKFDNAKNVNFNVNKEKVKIQENENLINEKFDTPVTFKTSKKIKIQLNFLAIEDNKKIADVINELLILGLNQRENLKDNGK